MRGSWRAPTTGIAILVVLLAGCGGDTTGNGQQPTVQTRPLAEHGLPDITSTGLYDSAPFSVTASTWSIHYSFDCGAVNGGEPDAGTGSTSGERATATPDAAALAKQHFKVVVLGAGNTHAQGSVVDRHGQDGQGAARIHGAGQYYLRILTDCHYHVRVGT